MKKIIFKIILVLLIIVALVYLYLTLAVNDKIEEHEEYKNKVKQDSIEYNSKKVESHQKTH